MSINKYQIFRWRRIPLFSWEWIPAVMGILILLMSLGHAANKTASKVKAPQVILRALARDFPNEPIKGVHKSDCSFLFFINAKPGKCYEVDLAEGGNVSFIIYTSKGELVYWSEPIRVLTEQGDVVKKLISDWEPPFLCFQSTKEAASGKTTLEINPRAKIDKCVSILHYPSGDVEIVFHWEACGNSGPGSVIVKERSLPGVPLIRAVCE